MVNNEAKNIVRKKIRQRAMDKDVFKRYSVFRIKDIIDVCQTDYIGAKNKLVYAEKTRKIVRIKNGVYISCLNPPPPWELSNFLFPDSYISGETILHQEGIIRQPSQIIQSITYKGRNKSYNIGGKIFQNYRTSLQSDKGIYYNKNNIRIATKERALLDVVYMRFYSKKYSLNNEINISLLNQEKIIELLSLYGKRIEKYFLKNISGTNKIFLNEEETFL